MLPLILNINIYNAVHWENLSFNVGYNGKSQSKKYNIKGIVHKEQNTGTNCNMNSLFKYYFTMFYSIKYLFIHYKIVPR